MQVLPGEAPPAALAGQTLVAGPGESPPTAMTAPEPGGEETVVQGVARIDLSTGTVTVAEAPPSPDFRAHRASPKPPRFPRRTWARATRCPACRNHNSCRPTAAM